MDHAQSTPFRHPSHPSPLRSRLVELSQQQQPEPGFETLEGKHISISGVPLSTLDIVQGVVLPERHTEKNEVSDKINQKIPQIKLYMTVLIE